MPWWLTTELRATFADSSPPPDWPLVDNSPDLTPAGWLVLLQTSSSWLPWLKVKGVTEFPASGTTGTDRASRLLIVILIGAFVLTDSGNRAEICWRRRLQQTWPCVKGLSAPQVGFLSDKTHSDNVVMGAELP